MATIKSYTDLEQSKKLAEILPIESADMFIADVVTPKDQAHSYNFHVLTTWGCKTFAEIKERESKYAKFIPCWSLAALLEALNFPSLTQNKEDEWEVCILDHDNDDYIKKTASNPLDACVDMIEKLYELKRI